MKQIKENKISMRPRSYFIFGSLITFTGLVACIVSSIFLVSIISFLLRKHGPMGDFRLSLMINSFPWWIPILAIVCLIFGIFFLLKYNFSYKTNYLFIIIGFIIAIIIAGWIIDKTGLDNLWLNQGPMKGMMRGYYQNFKNRNQLRGGEIK